MRKVLVILVAALFTVTAGPAAAATQNGCTFSVPKPTVVSKKVSFTIRITCSSHPAAFTTIARWWLT